MDASTSSEACVLVGDCLRPEARRRSDLLCGIENTEGLAALPSEVSSEDLHLWHAACVTHARPSAQELATILKVRAAAPWLIVRPNTQGRIIHLRLPEILSERINSEAAAVQMRKPCADCQGLDPDCPSSAHEYDN